MSRIRNPQAYACLVEDANVRLTATGPSCALGTLCEVILEARISSARSFVRGNYKVKTSVCIVGECFLRDKQQVLSSICLARSLRMRIRETSLASQVGKNHYALT